MQAEIRRQEEEQRLKDEKEAERRRLEEQQQQEEAEAEKQVCLLLGFFLFVADNLSFVLKRILRFLCPWLGSRVCNKAPYYLVSAIHSAVLVF